MPTRDTPWPAGTPCWIDLMVPDVDAALTFYGAVTNWRFTEGDPEFGNYRMCQADGRDAAGIGPVQSADQPSFWTVYFASDDLDGTAKLIADNGGSLLVPPMDVGDICRIAIAADDQGAVFGVFQARNHQGSQVTMEPGALVWESGMFADVPKARQFYGTVFGHGFAAIEGMDQDTYGAFTVGGESVGGIGGMMGAPAGTPCNWGAVVAVPDVDGSVSAAQQGGGSVIMPAQDTPFGRMATIADPFGAVLTVHGENTETPA
jgi:uncharacterized protein